jgi:hypothetical protein
MFYDGKATFPPSFIYPGICMGDYLYFDSTSDTWRKNFLCGYNVWNWIVAPFTNEEFTPPEYCVINDLESSQSMPLGPNITSVFSSSWPSQCPSPSHILATFAVVNIVVAVSSLVLGHQTVLHVLSCKLLGKEHPLPNRRQRMMQVVQLLLPLALQLLANSIITFLTRATPGYKDGFTFAQLFLFLAARPRITWLFAAWAANFASKTGAQEVPGFPEHLKIAVVELQGHNMGNVPTPMPGNPVREEIMSLWQEFMGGRSKKFFPYQRFAKGQLLAEAVLLAIASYSIGSTAHFASQSGFYDIYGTSQAQYEAYGLWYEYAAKMMYGGAIWWIICFPIAFTLLIIMFGELAQHTSSVTERSDNLNTIRIISSLILMVSLWLGQWLWLAGFVHLMGSL